MADATLKTDYKDDVLDTSKNTQRKYQMIQNEDGTVSFVDVTEYSQTGDSFGAKDVNEIAEAFNGLNSNMKDLFIVELATNDTYTIGANNNISQSVAPKEIDGYTPLAIAGWGLSSSNSAYCRLTRITLANGMINFTVINQGSANAVPRVSVYVLYKLNLE